MVSLEEHSMSDVRKIPRTYGKTGTDTKCRCVDICQSFIWRELRMKIKQFKLKHFEASRWTVSTVILVRSSTEITFNPKELFVLFSLTKLLQLHFPWKMTRLTACITCPYSKRAEMSTNGWAMILKQGLKSGYFQSSWLQAWIILYCPWADYRSVYAKVV